MSMSKKSDQDSAGIPDSGGDQAASRLRANHRFRLLSDTELESIPSPGFLVPGVVPKGSFGMIIGAPASGKSFLVLDWSMCISSGTDWNGQPIAKGAVLYIVAEGAGAYGERIVGWKEKHAWAGPTGVDFIKTAVHLSDDRDVDDMLDLLLAQPAPPVLIIFDTFARCFRGDENSVRDVSLAIANIDRIREVTGAAVLLVHHSRKDDAVERGSSALRGALDVLAHVRKDGDTVQLTCLKMKDAADFPDLRFRLVSAADSCVLQPLADGDSHDTDVPALSTRAIETLQVLPATPVTYAEWRDLAEAAGVPAGTFDKVRRALIAAKLVVRLPDGLYIRKTDDRDTGDGDTPDPRIDDEGDRDA
jgi:hypothetical protein